MIKTSIKNFFKSLGFYFIPLGVMAFFIVLYLAFMIPGIVTDVRDTFQAIATKLGAVEFNWEKIQGVIMSKVFEYGADPTALMSLTGNPELIINLLKDTVMEAFGVEEVTNEIIALIQQCVTSISMRLIGLLAIMIVSFIAGFVVLEVLLRRYLTDINMIKSILVSILNGILIAGVLVLLSYLYSNNEVAMWIVIVVAAIILIFGTLLEAYLFYGIRKVKFTQVINIKNVFTLILGSAISGGLFVGLICLCLLIPSRFVGIFIMIPFVELGICVLELNACAYVSSMAKENKIDKRVQKEVNAQIAEKKED